MSQSHSKAPDPPPLPETRQPARLVAAAKAAEQWGSSCSWLFPLALTLAILLAAWAVAGAIQVDASALGPELSARLTWGMAAMLFLVFFVFSVVVFNLVMFRCGRASDAVLACIATTVSGLAILLWTWLAPHHYPGPVAMAAQLEASAFRLPGVRLITAVSVGAGVWAALLLLSASCVILRHEAVDAEVLSRQLRASRILIHTAAALLIAGVSQTAALHKWPGHLNEPVKTNPSEGSSSSGTAAEKSSPSPSSALQSSAIVISTTVGTVFSLVLAAAYLPLGILLRKRAYRVICPWERTESWLAVHGFALMPTQQLAKILLILSPLIAGGPVNYLITLLGER